MEDYEEKPGDYDLIMKNTCPRCSGELYHSKGCAICRKCGFKICEEIAEFPERREKHL